MATRPQFWYLAAAVALVVVGGVLCWRPKRTVLRGVEELIGNTPIIEIQSLSKKSGCRIVAKLELANPGGSNKDRVALAVLDAAEAAGVLQRGSEGHVFEGTSGSTGISLTLLCNVRGYTAHIVVPEDTSVEKIALLKSLGADVILVSPASIVDENHYVNVARKQAVHMRQTQGKNVIFVDQFENETNWKAHFASTGPEIWCQMHGKLDAFVSGAGTGGTIAGVARYLKLKSRGQVCVVLADPQGSGLANKVKYNVLFNADTEKEGTRRRHQVDTRVEGIGLNRITANFQAGLAYADDAVSVSDSDALEMARSLVINDGLFVGGSSAVNCVAAYKYALSLGPGHTVLTVLCDSGARHMSKFYQ